MKQSEVGFGRFFWIVTASHMVTYMVVGIAAYNIMDYPALMADECSIMISASSPMVALGPTLQVIRGLIFAVALYPFRNVFLTEPAGALKLWGLFLGLAILSTAGPAPGSVEGMIYTKTPIADQIVGLWEVVVQTLLASYLIVHLGRNSSRRWDVVMGIAVALIVLMSVMGALAR